MKRSDQAEPQEPSCCCGLFSITQGCTIIMTVESIMSVINIVYYTLVYTKVVQDPWGHDVYDPYPDLTARNETLPKWAHPPSDGFLAIPSMVMFSLVLVCSLLVIGGIRIVKPPLLIPKLALNVILIVVTIATIIQVSVAVGIYGLCTRYKMLLPMSCLTLVAHTASLGLVAKSYRYLKFKYGYLMIGSAAKG